MTTPSSIHHPKVPEGHVYLNPDEPNDEFPMYGETAVPPKKPGTLRIWVDGCFDMLHFGHTNAIRQAASLGAELFVGCHSDEEIIKHKGPPMMHEQERYDALRACKWVTYVVENAPYVTRVKDMKRFDVDFVAHGDDMSVGLDGRNSYQEVIDAGMMKIVKRTDGISTTDLVGRMLLCTKQHHGEAPSEIDQAVVDKASVRYLTTSRKIVQYSNNRVPKESDTVVYVDGAFDLFHIGHINVLKKARAFGTYLIVGIHEDSIVNGIKGGNYPIMNMNERVLGVLGCRYVDEVVMGVPYAVTQDLISSLGVSVVVAGKVRDAPAEVADPYAVPKALGIFQEVDSTSELTTDALIQRVLEHRAAFLERQRKKVAKDSKAAAEKPEQYKNVREVA